MAIAEVEPYKESQPLPHSPKQRTVTFFPQRFHRLLWQSDAIALKRFKSGIKVYEGEFEAERGRERFENASSGWYDFAADTIAWYEACMRSVIVGEKRYGPIANLSEEFWRPLD